MISFLQTVRGLSLGEWLTNVASVTSSLTIIFGFYYKFIKKPADDKREKKRQQEVEAKRYQDDINQRKLRDIIAEQGKPMENAVASLQASVDAMNQKAVDDRHIIDGLLDVSRKNAEILEKQDKRIDNIGDRLLIVETIVHKDGTPGFVKKLQDGKELK